MAVLGVDIGGTKVAAGLIGPDGNVIFKTRQPMKTRGSADDGMSAVHAVIRECMEAADRPVEEVGVIAPGPLDIFTGVIVNPPNLPCWVEFPLAETIRRGYGLRTFVDNDANAAGLAEALWGAGVGFKSVFYATLGTGLGTAILIDQKLHYGRTGMAAEGGHISIDFRGPVLCGCGKPGCVEGLVAGPGIARRARQRVQAGEASAMLELAGGDISAITAQTVVEAWRNEDEVATAIINDTIMMLTVWFGNIIDVLEPHVIVVGGGLGEVTSEWFLQIQHGLEKWSLNPRAQEIAFRTAKFGVDAGIVGAAALCYAESSVNSQAGTR